MSVTPASHRRSWAVAPRADGTRRIDHLFNATEGIDALCEIDWDNEEEDR